MLKKSDLLLLWKKQTISTLLSQVDASRHHKLSQTPRKRYTSVLQWVVRPQKKIEKFWENGDEFIIVSLLFNKIDPALQLLQSVCKIRFLEVCEICFRHWDDPLIRSRFLAGQWLFKFGNDRRGVDQIRRVRWMGQQLVAQFDPFKHEEVEDMSQWAVMEREPFLCHMGCFSAIIRGIGQITRQSTVLWLLCPSSGSRSI